MAISQTDAFIFPIQWARGFNEAYRFRTEVISSENGTEQRISQRVNPRIDYELDAFIRWPEQAYLLERLAENQGRSMFISHPRNGGKLEAAVTAGVSNALQFTGGSRPGWAVAGNKIFIEQGFTVEMAEILSTSGADIVNLTDTVLNSYDIGAKLLRGVPGQLKDKGELRAATNRVGISNISFEADPVDEWHYGWSGSAPESLNGRELMNLAHNWSGDLRLEFHQPVDDLDLQRGPTDRLFPSDFTNRKTRMSAILRNDAQLERSIGLFYRMKGRWKSFYAPSLIHDINPISTLTDGTNTFKVAGSTFHDQFAGSTINRRIGIYAKDGTVQHKVISGTAVDVNGDTDITLLTNLSGTYAPEDLKNVQWVHRARFETDALDIEWLTDGTAATNLNIRAIEDI